jgi:hypothetical protein
MRKATKFLREGEEATKYLREGEEGHKVPEGS